MLSYYQLESIIKQPVMIDQILHFLCDFLVNPKIFPGFPHDKIGNPHNGAMLTAQVYRKQNVAHNQGIAAEIKIKINLKSWRK